MTRALIFVLGSCLLGQPLEPHLAAARKAESSGDFATAEREYEKSIAVRPDAATFQRLGLVRHLQNKFAAAIPAFEASLRLDPNQWASHLFLGIDLYRTNRFDVALNELERAATLRANDPDVRFWLGATHLARKDYFAGLTMLEELSREQPNNVEVLQILAENYAAFGTTLLNSVAEKFPDTPAGLQVHAQALEFEGANEAALDVYRDLERLAPGRPGVSEAMARLKATASAPRLPSSPTAGGESPVRP